MAERANAVTFKGSPLTLIGPEIKPGDTAPDFTCVKVLDPFKLKDTGAKARLFSVVPSLDTPVCHEQTKKFEQAITALKDKVAAFTISLDMPFAQKRWCSTEGVEVMQVLSDLHDQSFGKNYGVLIKGLPIPLLARAVFVVDKNNKIVYSEYVPEVTQFPNYDKALAALKTAAG